jgi:hypothetical protein
MPMQCILSYYWLENYILCLLIGGEKCGGYQVEVRMFPKMFPNGENPCLHVLVLANIAAKNGES